MATSETIPESGPVHPSGGTVYATPYVAPAHGFVGLGERPEKFNGKDFKRWQQKMLFYLTTLNLARFLQEDAPDLGENPDWQTVAAVDAWKHSDFLCKNYILNGLDNALYNVYSPMVNAKALWESLERKYKTEDTGSKKFVVGKFLDFKMVDSKTVINQVQEFQLILHDIHAEGMVLGESFQVAALIEKLPPTWKNFKNYLKHKRKDLKHKRKEMKLEDLIVRLRIEEDNRQSEKKAGNYHQEAKANVVEQELSKVLVREEIEEISAVSIICRARGERESGHSSDATLALKWMNIDEVDDDDEMDRRLNFLKVTNARIDNIIGVAQGNAFGEVRLHIVLSEAINSPPSYLLPVNYVALLLPFNGLLYSLEHSLLFGM
ncbi:hypothetical protein RJ639_038764 [Escallonia herrerae]|uniref:Uncharacterized protein n=1 Tax=Escallonia herrerae TaxID=1293975 RepID=A0AA88WN42_9ASTE|nr:hypothetical protein RJ639_038764 [Escallonia herrerae]